MGVKIIDIVLFRTDTDLYLFKKPNALLDAIILGRVTSWDPSESKTLELTQGYGTTLSLPVRKFDSSTIPLHTLPEDEQDTYSHPYGLTDLDEAERIIREFIRESVRPYILSLTKSDHISLGLLEATLKYWQNRERVCFCCYPLSQHANRA